MGLLSLSSAQAARLRRFRRNTWKAVILCAVLRLADASLGLGLLATSTTQAGQMPQATASLECQP